MVIRRSQKSKWWQVSKKRQAHCESCGRKIKMGRMCYWCGKRRGLW